MKQKGILLGLCAFLLFSCGNASKTSVDTVSYGSDFLADLSLLLAGPYLTEEEKENKSYNITYESALTSSGKNTVYTVIVSYKDTVLDGLKVILCPGDYLKEGTSHNLPNAGYNETFILGPTKDASKNQAKGVRLSIEMSVKQTSVYASVTYNGTSDLYQFTEN